MSQRVFVRNLGGTPIVLDVAESTDGVTDGDKGDITVSGGGTIWSIDSDVIREKLTADRIYYVRSNGSDSNDGLADTAGGAFLTIQHAVNVVVALDLAIYQVTIQINDAIFAETVTLKSYIGKGPIIIKGDGSAVPSAGGHYQINGNNASYAVFASAVLGEWILEGLDLTSTASWNLYVDQGSIVRIKKMRFGASALGQITAQSNGFITNEHLGTFSNAFAFSGNALWCLFAINQGFIQVIGTQTWTLTGTPAYSQQFAYADNNSTIMAQSITFSGSATGTRFGVASGSVINTNGGGANYFPGNAAGTGTTPGVSPYGLYI